MIILSGYKDSRNFFKTCKPLNKLGNEIYIIFINYNKRMRGAELGAESRRKIYKMLWNHDNINI